MSLFTGNEIKIFRNIGNGTFDTTPIQTISEQPGYMKLADLDISHNFYDLVTFVNGRYVKIRKNSNGILGSPTTIDAGSPAIQVEVGDVNYDDYPDLIVVRDDGKLRIYLNMEGTIHTTYDYEISSGFFGDDVRDVEIGDMNNDGWNDLVIAESVGRISIWINTHSAPLFQDTPGQYIDYFLPYAEIHSLRLADIENSGGLSVAFSVPSILGNGAIYVFKHDGNPAPPRNLYLIGMPGQHPTLHWDANTERDFAHYDVWRYRELYDNEYIRIALNVTNNYYVDEQVTIAGIGTPAGGVYYKTKAVDDVNNASDFSNEVNTFEAGNSSKSKRFADFSSTLAPAKLGLFANYPNPFIPTTTISFYLPTDQNVSLTVYSLTGEKVATLLNGFTEKGVHRVNWNGANQSGNPVSSEIYVYQLTAGDKRLVKKMLLAK